MEEETKIQKIYGKTMLISCLAALLFLILSGIFDNDEFLRGVSIFFGVIYFLLVIPMIFGAVLANWIDFFKAVKGKAHLFIFSFLAFILAMAVLGLIYRKAGLEWVIIIVLTISVAFLVDKVADLKSRIKKLEEIHESKN